MKLSELNKKESYLLLPKIDKNEVKLLWIVDWYDGPLEGMLLLQDNKYWLQVCDEATETKSYYRRYLIIRLSEGQLKEEEYWHELFKEKVGTHWDFDDDNAVNIRDKIKPQGLAHEFYEPYNKRVKTDFSDNEVIGWFED